MTPETNEERLASEAATVVDPWALVKDLTEEVNSLTTDLEQTERFASMWKQAAKRQRTLTGMLRQERRDQITAVINLNHDRIAERDRAAAAESARAALEDAADALFEEAGAVLSIIEDRGEWADLMAAMSAYEEARALLASPAGGPVVVLRTVATDGHIVGCCAGNEMSCGCCHCDEAYRSEYGLKTATSQQQPEQAGQ